MSNYFSDLEGLRLAVEIETQGYEFYRQAYENSQVNEHKLLFSFLMQEELNHAAKFKSMYDDIKQTKDADSDTYLYDPEVSRYLQVIVEGHIFPRQENTAWYIGQLQTVEGVLETALQAEKDSILFYDEMMNNARFPQAKEIFAELKAEEQTHVVKLREMLSSFKYLD